MAHSTVYMTNGTEIKKAPMGFSWTTFLFGFFVPLLRGDWIWAVALLILGLLLWWIPAVVMAFFYNKLYMKSLFDRGFRVHNQTAVSDDQIKNYVGYMTVPKHE